MRPIWSLLITERMCDVGRNQHEVSKKIGVCDSILSKAQRGESIQMRSLEKIANGLGLEIAFLDKHNKPIKSFYDEYKLSRMEVWRISKHMGTSLSGTYNLLHRRTKGTTYTYDRLCEVLDITMTLIPKKK